MVWWGWGVPYYIYRIFIGERCNIDVAKKMGLQTDLKEFQKPRLHRDWVEDVMADLFG